MDLGWFEVDFRLTLRQLSLFSTFLKPTNLVSEAPKNPERFWRLQMHQLQQRAKLQSLKAIGNVWCVCWFDVFLLSRLLWTYLNFWLVKFCSSECSRVSQGFFLTQWNETKHIWVNKHMQVTALGSWKCRYWYWFIGCIFLHQPTCSSMQD